MHYTSNIQCFTDFNLCIIRFIKILRETKTRFIVKRFPRVLKLHLVSVNQIQSSRFRTRALGTLFYKMINDLMTTNGIEPLRRVSSLLTELPRRWRPIFVLSAMKIRIGIGPLAVPMFPNAVLIITIIWIYIPLEITATVQQVSMHLIKGPFKYLALQKYS